MLLNLLKTNDRVRIPLNVKSLWRLGDAKRRRRKKRTENCSHVASSGRFPFQCRFGFSLIAVNNNNNSFCVCVCVICIVQLTTVHQIFTRFFIYLYFVCDLFQFLQRIFLVLLTFVSTTCCLQCDFFSFDTKSYVYFIVCSKWCILYIFFYFYFSSIVHCCYTPHSLFNDSLSLYLPLAVLLHL